VAAGTVLAAHMAEAAAAMRNIAKVGDLRIVATLAVAHLSSTPPYQVDPAVVA